MSEIIKKQDISRIVWKACDTFRGVIDPAQYKDDILTMLFVKYLSDTGHTGAADADEEQFFYFPKHQFLSPEAVCFSFTKFFMPQV